MISKAKTGKFCDFVMRENFPLTNISDSDILITESDISSDVISEFVLF